jgi:hypothetical protein
MVQPGVGSLAPGRLCYILVILHRSCGPPALGCVRCTRMRHVVEYPGYTDTRAAHFPKVKIKIPVFVSY